MQLHVLQTALRLVFEVTIHNFDFLLPEVAIGGVLSVKRLDYVFFKRKQNLRQNNSVLVIVEELASSENCVPLADEVV